MVGKCKVNFFFQIAFAIGCPEGGEGELLVWMDMTIMSKKWWISVRRDRSVGDLDPVGFLVFPLFFFFFFRFVLSFFRLILLVLNLPLSLSRIFLLNF